MVPSYARKWKPDDRIWIVRVEWRDSVIKLLRSYFNNVEIVDDSKDRKRESVNSCAVSPYHELVAKVPNSTLVKVYRLLATELHPDKGGAHELMVRVNSAWDRIKNIRGLA
jgi:hypothetical protein